MKRMKKRLLAMLLALMLVVGLLPVGVLAVDGPTVIDGEPIEGAGVIYYRIYAHQALKMLHTALPEDEISEDTSIEGIEIHLKDAPVADRNCDFMPAGANNLYYWYPTAGITGANGVGYASNIKSLTIEYNNGNDEKSVVIQAGALQCRVIGSRTYSIESNNNDEYVVAFYNTKGSGAQSVYDELYAIRFVEANTALGHDRMPEDPVYDEDYASAFVFTNWDKGATGGDPYLPYDLVNIDTVVYARKTTSSGSGGTEYHVMNTNNVLLERFIELYNDEHDTTYTVSSIVIDSVKIRVNGTNGSTNSNYWNNKWKSASNPYYRVVNSGIAGDHPTISNTHVPHGEAQSITIFATVGSDADASVTIDVGNYKGDVSLSQVQDNIVEIIVNETGEEPDPEPDHKPETNPDVSNVSVVVDCTTNDEHASETLSIKDSTYEFETVLVDGQWTCTVVITPDDYVAEYNETNGTHTLTPESQTGELLYVYAGSSWQYVGDGTPTVTFTVKCETTEPEPVAKLNVDKTVAIPDGKGTAAVGDVLEYTVTISSLNDVAAEDVMVTDTMWESGSSVKIGGKDGQLQYVTADGEGGYCVTVDVPADGSVVIYYTYIVPETDAGKTVGNTVTVDNMSDTIYTTVDENEEPEPTPDKPHDPTEDELNQLYVDLECINADAQHADKRFHLDLDNSVVIVDFTTGICTVQPNYGFILATYNKQVADGHTYADEVGSEKTFTLVWVDGAWDNGGGTSITRQVKCDTPEPDEPTPPTDKELEDLLGNEVVIVECTNDKTPEHREKKYGLLEGSYDVDLDEGGDTCTITIRAGDYIVEYNEFINNPDLPHGLVNYDNGRTATITLTRGTNGWQLASGETGKVTFEVKCGSTIVEVPGEGGWYPVYVEPEDPTDPDQTGVADLLETDDHIQYLFGYPDGSFGPDRNMTRAEAAQMFYNLLKNQNVDAEPAFDDVPEGAWYATPVNVMAELGIVDGVGDDKFEPNREITRAEFTTMAMRFADVPSGGVNIFTDVAPSDWFYSYVVNSIQYGWIEGYGDGTFRPDRLITRAEVTTIVNRMLDRQADMAFVIQNRDKLTKFTDLTTEHWAYYTIVEATNEHNYTKPAIGEDWTSLKK